MDRNIVTDSVLRRRAPPIRWDGLENNARIQRLGTIFSSPLVSALSPQSLKCGGIARKFSAAVAAGDPDDSGSSHPSELAKELNKDGREITREGPARYTAYLARAQAVLVRSSVAIKQFTASHIRYMAYSSDIGEGLRPVLSERLIKGAYGLVFLYIAGDVGYLYRNLSNNGASRSEINRGVTHALTFHGVASLALPTLIIHTAVKQSYKMFLTFGRFTKWGPCVVGLSIIPLMPIVDEPVEELIDKAFHKFWPVDP